MFTNNYIKSVVYNNIPTDDILTYFDHFKEDNDIYKEKLILIYVTTFKDFNNDHYITLILNAKSHLEVCGYKVAVLICPKNITDGEYYKKHGIKKYKKDSNHLKKVSRFMWGLDGLFVTSCGMPSYVYSSLPPRAIVKMFDSDLSKDQELVEFISYRIKQNMDDYVQTFWLCETSEIDKVKLPLLLDGMITPKSEKYDFSNYDNIMAIDIYNCSIKKN